MSCSARKRLATQRAPHVGGVATGTTARNRHRGPRRPRDPECGALPHRRRLRQPHRADRRSGRWRWRRWRSTNTIPIGTEIRFEGDFTISLPLLAHKRLAPLLSYGAYSKVGARPQRGRALVADLNTSRDQAGRTGIPVACKPAWSLQKREIIDRSACAYSVPAPERRSAAV